jgi:hypothetical protein
MRSLREFYVLSCELFDALGWMMDHDTAGLTLLSSLGVSHARNS